MNHNNAKIHVALAIACAALGLSIYNFVHGRNSVAGSVRSAKATESAMPASTAPAAGPTTPPPGPPPAVPGPKHYVRFEIPNPAVSVTQKPDGIFDIRTTDSSLVGSVMTITAITESGERDQVFIRIPR